MFLIESPSTPPPRKVEMSSTRKIEDGEWQYGTVASYGGWDHCPEGLKVIIKAARKERAEKKREDEEKRKLQTIAATVVENKPPAAVIPKHKRCGIKIKKMTFVEVINIDEVPNSPGSVETLPTLKLKEGQH